MSGGPRECCPVTLVDRGALQFKNSLRCVLFMNFTINYFAWSNTNQGHPFIWPLQYYNSFLSEYKSVLTAFHLDHNYGLTCPCLLPKQVLWHQNTFWCWSLWFLFWSFRHIIYFDMIAIYLWQERIPFFDTD
jgi:hypothetical protein